MSLLQLNLKMSNTNWGVIRKNQRLFFNQLSGCPMANFDLELYAKKYFMLKVMLQHPKSATNAKVVFKLCSMLITTITCNA